MEQMTFISACLIISLVVLMIATALRRIDTLAGVIFILILLVLLFLTGGIRL